MTPEGSYTIYCVGCYTRCEYKGEDFCPACLALSHFERSLLRRLWYLGSSVDDLTEAVERMNKESRMRRAWDWLLAKIGK